MLPKEEKLIITFHTTAEAMAMEKSCRERQLPGRLIPVPREISAGCGLSWCTDPAAEKRIFAGMREAGLEAQGTFLVMI